MNNINSKDEKFIEEYEKSQEILRKKLIRKVYSIILSMVLILVGIIIVEFKEYSNEYKEYKIGKNDLGPRDLVWAGIMGTPPRYYELDTKYGQGYKEFETRHIRKALEDANFNLVYRYMSPNRLEFEFERKHPICFYERKWNNPVEYFKKVRPEILSIPFFYSGNETKKIVFRKGDHHRFKKHLDEKGNINLNSLIQDSTLKTELIRKVNYPWPYSISNITYGKKQEDGSIWDIVKQKYQRNIDLVILHTNDQILQMLERKRFDYQFLETLEYDDFEMSRYTRNGIDTLIYEVKTVHDVDDPNLVFHSVACGNHSLVKEAMPIINEVIKNMRTYAPGIGEIISYTKKLNPDSKMERLNLESNALLKVDEWYGEQFKNLKIASWPMYRNNQEKKDLTPIEIEELLKTIPPHSKKPMWQIIESQNSTGEKSLLIINEVEYNNILFGGQNLRENQYHYSRLINYKDNGIIVDQKETFKELVFPMEKYSQYSNIVIFARGVNDKDFQKFIKFLQVNSLNIQQNKLEGIYLANGSTKLLKSFILSIPRNIKKLELMDVPLREIFLGEILNKLKNLHILKIDSWDIAKKDLISIFTGLPSELTTFSISQKTMTNALPYEVAQIFVNKGLSSLRNLEFKNFPLEDRFLELILDAIPVEMNSLSLESSQMGGGISSLLIEKFLHRVGQQKLLKKLKLNNLRFSLKKDHVLILPNSLEELSLTNSIGLDYKNFHRIIFSPEMKLHSLDLSNNNINDFNVKKIFSLLCEKMNMINLSNNKLTGKIFFDLYYLKQIRPMKLEELNLSNNPINDFGMIFLSQSLKLWDVKKMKLNNLKITDESLIHLANNNLSELKSISLGDNFITSKAINTFIIKHFYKLESLELTNVKSLDLSTLGNYMPKGLNQLGMKGNVLSDNEIKQLAPKLPKELKNLNISLSRMGAMGALSLAQHMPSLTHFYFNFKYGEEELGYRFIYKSLSPFLVNFSNFLKNLSYENAVLLSKNFPPHLRNLSTMPKFEKEECEIILNSLPGTLIQFIVGNYTRKNYETFIKHIPSALMDLVLPPDIDEVTLKSLLKILEEKNPSLRLDFAGRKEYYSRDLIKYLSKITLDLSGPVEINSFRDISFPPIVIFGGLKRSDIPRGFLQSLKMTQLQDLCKLTLQNLSIDAQEFVDFLAKLPPYLLSLEIINSDFQLKDVEKIIKALPSHLTYLNISGNKFGEEGIKKFREFKTKMEEKTQLPFELIE